jgi:crotonobetainyl-CoA:carnitine CoA-transferase CaiB-like acyl-CoA transferase
VHGPIMGSHEGMPGIPFRFASRPQFWHSSAAPSLGQHSREVLGGLAGVSDSTLNDLERDAVIGHQPKGWA